MNYGTKETLRRMMHALPTYRKALREAVMDEMPGALECAVRRAIRDVPFYRDYAQYLDGGFDLSRLPIIHKADIMRRPKELVSRRAWRPLLKQKQTGGSSGDSLELYHSISFIIRNTAYRDQLFNAIDKHARIAVLRGTSPADGRISQQVTHNVWLLSSYQINASTLSDYIKLLRDEHINCIHAYPSSIVTLARHMQACGIQPELSDLKGVITSSEIFTRKDKELVQSVMPGISIIDLYGHNEGVLFAASFDSGPFVFAPAYGHIEFIPTGERYMGLDIAEIVGTSIMNRCNPLLRYATEDYALLDRNGNAVEILGRSMDFVVNRMGLLTPVTISTRDISMRHAVNFQYYQDTPGILIYRVEPTADFSSDDEALLLQDLQSAFAGTMECHIEVVDAVERTAVGKQLQIIQKLNLNDYR